MSDHVLDPDTNRLLIRRIIFMLKALHEAEKIGKQGFESTSWHGQLLGFRHALEIIIGSKKTSEILDAVREEVHLDAGKWGSDELLKRVFHRPEHTRNNLGLASMALGHLDKALAESLTALERNPTSARRYACLAACYILLNRFREARSFLDEARSKNIESPELHLCSYLAAFLDRDIAKMEEEVMWAKDKPIVHALFYLEARTNAFFGRLSASRDFSRRAVEATERIADRDLAASYLADAALREALFGNVEEGRRQAKSALRVSDQRDVVYETAFCLALSGEVKEAQSLLDKIYTSLPEENVVLFNYLPTLNAQLALSRNDAFKAVQVLQEANPYELGDVGNTTLFPVLVRGEAFLAAHQSERAAAEFQKILDNPGLVGNGPVGIRGRLGIAKAYAQQGDITKAKLAYEDFFTLWRKADPDIPILKAAQEDYFKLH